MENSYDISLVIRWGFSFKNNLKDLDLSCKTDLDLWDCFGGGKLISELNYMYTTLI